MQKAFALIKTFIIPLTLAFSLVLSACEKEGGEINTHEVQGENNVAVKGYDVVSYFKESKPVEGSKSHMYKWNGVKWFFDSEEHKKAFAENPEKYAPQFGGYCAFGVSVPKKKIDIEPEAWYIYKDKLYLNYTIPTQKIWLEDKDGHIKAAEENWPEVKKQ